MEVIAPSYIDDLYRIALLQCGDKQAALSGVMEVVSEAESNAGHWRTQRHRFLWAARLLSQRLGKRPSAPAGFGESFPEGLVEVIALLQEARPELRSGLAMVCTGHVKSGEVLQLLRYRSREWRVALVRFREQVAAQGLDEGALKASLSLLQLTAEERILLEQTVSARPRRRRGSDIILAVAAVCLGFCVLIGWFAWEHWRASPAMVMRRHMTEFLELNHDSGIAGLELFEGRAGETQDWLFLHGMEGVLMPEVFANVRVAAARVLKWNGTTIAQFPTHTLPGLLVVVESEALGMQEEEGERSPGRASFGDWSAVWANSGQYMVLWMVQAGASELEQCLQKLSTNSRVQP